MDVQGPVLNPISNRIIGCALTVAGALGTGFLEKVYENALAYELCKAGIAIEQQCSVSVMYDGTSVGQCCVDLLVEKAIIVDLKTVQQLSSVRRAQRLNYLRATGMHLCLLMLRHATS